MEPTFFATPADFRAWLEEHHASATELLVGFYKKDSGLPSITWPESVDEALCFGWIDGVRRRLDDVSYTIRFTPRKKGSIWSEVNINRVGELTALGRMRPTGIAAFDRRIEARSGVYAFEQRGTQEFDTDQERRFRDNAAAWEFFQAQPPSYRKTVIWWVISAKRQETRDRRLTTLIETSAAGRRLE